MFKIAGDFSQSTSLVAGKVVKGPFYLDDDLVKVNYTNQDGSVTVTLEPKPDAQPLGKTSEEAELAAHQYAFEHNF